MLRRNRARNPGTGLIVKSGILKSLSDEVGEEGD